MAVITSPKNEAHGEIEALADLDKGMSVWGAGESAAIRQNFRSLAEQGQVIAQTVLGVMYRLGRGVPRDYAEAFKWFGLAAKQGNPTAQNNLGVMYVDGEGVAQDKAQSAKWFRLAAEQGNATAQLNLAAMLADGSGVPSDCVAAHMWCNISASGGLEEARQYRDIVAENMTPTEISEAQRRFRMRISFKYQKRG